MMGHLMSRDLLNHTLALLGRLARKVHRATTQLLNLVFGDLGATTLEK
jgi:hypothetical protein